MRSLCTKCLRAKNSCFCSKLNALNVSYKFIFLMHPLEFRSKTGSGRMAHLNLKKSELIVGVNFSNNDRLNSLLNSHECYVLYPGKSSINLNESAQSIKKESAIIVIDATWPCAKKMMKLSNNLHKIPRLSFSTQRKSQFKIKHQPLENCLSTIESVHETLTLLNEKNIDSLLEPFTWMVNYQIECAKDPTKISYRQSGTYKNQDKLPKSKKWQDRALFFQG